MAATAGESSNGRARGTAGTAASSGSSTIWVISILQNVLRGGRPSCSSPSVWPSDRTASASCAFAHGRADSWGKAENAMRPAAPACIVMTSATTKPTTHRSSMLPMLRTIDENPVRQVSARSKRREWQSNQRLGSSRSQSPGVCGSASAASGRLIGTSVRDVFLASSLAPLRCRMARKLGCMPPSE
ncbi:hypothetical protein SAMN05518861_106261 [Mesorhizobium sp. YR577]|nr:hypothetical protein SAMN05518861_106261 [Mesorhizobium sp. YR577]